MVGSCNIAAVGAEGHHKDYSMAVADIDHTAHLGRRLAIVPMVVDRRVVVALVRQAVEAVAGSAD